MIDIELLNKRLEQEGAKWRAGETPYSKLSIDELRRLATGRPRIIKTPPDRSPLPEPGSPQKFDQVVDWRNRDGKSYVTPVKAQGGCGTCTSFAVIGLVESMALIEHGVTLDLSEADLAFCGTHTNDCSGWDCDLALKDIESRGVVTEIRLPYFQDFLPHHTSWNGDVPQRITIPDHDAHAVKVKSNSDIFDVAQRKSYLSEIGPLTAGITCYDEFSFYKGDGIFSPTSAAINVGGHDILIIGYSEIEQYWLIKNSWDVSWGNNGFGKIAYGTCDIDIETATEKTYFNSCSGVLIPQRVLDEIVQSVSAVNLVTISNATRCDAFYSPDDKDRHIIVVASDGDISEVYFQHAPVSETHLIQVDGLIDLAAFYTDDDNNRHVLTIDTSGGVKEVYYDTHGISQVQIATIKNAARVSGFYDVDDKSRHALIATTDGKVIEIAYGQGSPKQTQVAALDDIIDICAFYTTDDRYSHVIVATANGNITEVYYSPTKAGGTTVISNVTDPRAIAGFYSGNEYFSRRVQIQTGNNHILEIRFDASDTPVIHPLYNGAPVADIGGFVSTDDEISHCMVLQTTGQIVEMYY
jgi:hypothetical protein